MSTSEGDRWLTVKEKEKNIYVTKVKLLMTIKVPVLKDIYPGSINVH